MRSFLSHACNLPRSQALPGNALPCRLCLPNERPPAASNPRGRASRQAFPGRAWEPGVMAFLVLLACADLSPAEDLAKPPAAKPKLALYVGKIITCAGKSI